MSLSLTRQEQSVHSLLRGIVDPDSMSKRFGEISVSNFTLDSRTVSKGSLFAAVPGEQADGRHFAEQAMERGAEGVVFEKHDAPLACKELEKQDKAVAVSGLSKHVSLIAARLYSDPSRGLKVIGVTGTNGKTTCVTLLQQSLNELGLECAALGTLGAAFNGDVEKSNLTTADPIAIQRSLCEFKERGADAVCMEVSSHGLEQDRVSAVDFNVAVFTNLSQDHLDYHGTMQAYGNAKRKLFEMSSLDIMILNADDKLGQDILSVPHDSQVVSFGYVNADVVPKKLVVSQCGISFDLSWGDEKERLSSSLLCEINVPNLLSVAATLLAMGYRLADLAKVFPKLTPPPGRMERFSGKEGCPTVVVDYSHTPDSLQRALQGLKLFSEGNIWVVFGCGGDRDKGKRPLMGQVAQQYADYMVVTNDNPRNEEPARIAKEITEGVSNGGKSVLTILDRRQAISHAIENAGSNDIILVAGKGHEITQTIGSEVLEFSDREVVCELLEAKK